MNAIPSSHAIKRIHERMGLPKRASRRLAKTAFARGKEVTVDITSGRLPEFPSINITDRAFLFANHVFIFARIIDTEIWISKTVIPAPRAFRHRKFPSP